MMNQQQLNNHNLDLYSIAKEYNIDLLIQIEKDDYYCQHNGEDLYINNCIITAFHDILYLGIYNDEEIKIAGFFHELGHTIAKYGKNKYTCEVNAWIEGEKIANKYNFVFTEKILHYKEQCLSTYLKYKDKNY